MVFQNILVTQVKLQKKKNNNTTEGCEHESLAIFALIRVLVLKHIETSFNMLVCIN